MVLGQLLTVRRTYSELAIRAIASKFPLRLSRGVRSDEAVKTSL